MKAIIVPEYGKPEVLTYMDIDIPKIKPNQVLIQVEKTSVNYADVKSRYGQGGNGRFPFIPGLDAAGVIVETGTEISRFQKGDRVIAFPAEGSYAEYVAADENLTFSIPDEVSFETAAACPTVSFLSYKMLADIARLEKGETVLVHSAAGGVGTTAIQMAKILGAGKVIGTVGREAKVPVALEAGADHVVVYEKENFADLVNSLTEGKGADIILDSLAGPITQQSFDCLADYGRMIQFGNSTGETGVIKTNDLHKSCRSVLGYSLGTTRKKRPETLRETANQVMEYLKNGKLNVKIGHTFPLKEAAAAHQLIESRLSTGKIILDIR
ncbi:NADPH:quinone oxidoreductase family protein [Bacillus sp. ISL-47]|uniref:quinone oxidoreductase family protein n=1 Tax=Bacillus sp. ISL-47 TaxID=2819130 RepID=UPI001BEADEB0|nr:NADPH:quinone oxidoreductase family protein [Bacillus sp. ISL-47]MBT2688677.1 NADPH:quinone oxidoreductase family protein [Bacillus sp. ISL-47]MBT2709983.1 NADPH:quinone oxidoreductase family protein [Pseudomonas sp. ISL-84]